MKAQAFYLRTFTDQKVRAGQQAAGGADTIRPIAVTVVSTEDNSLDYIQAAVEDASSRKVQETFRKLAGVDKAPPVYVPNESDKALWARILSERKFSCEFNRLWAGEVLHVPRSARGTVRQETPAEMIGRLKSAGMTKEEILAMVMELVG